MDRASPPLDPNGSHMKNPSVASSAAWTVALIAAAPVLAQTKPAKPNTVDRKATAVTTESKPKHTNRLINATSPYLLQHAHNPVDWNEWGDEALEKAKREDKPIFLSIGYSACHWCHVMEHESFETEEVAAVLNEHFVAIKVDREERPDIDEIYMAFTQALTGHGGWPMSVWLTPDTTPFFAGTYFPKEQFLQTLGSIADAWKNDRQHILGSAESAREFFKGWASGPPPTDSAIAWDVVDRTAIQLARYFDTSKGGLGSSGNKFPPSMAMDLLLRVYKRTGKSELFAAVDLTLDNMARGGIYDHLGGGISRYSTDPDWLVPHFEKMLYDQALVSSIYLDAYQVSKKPEYATVAADIFDYVLRDLQSDAGGIYSARDADSDGLEGAFYIWTVDEVTETLGEEEGRLFCAYYDVTERGNWFEQLGHAPPGPKNILHIDKRPAAFAKLHGLDVAELHRRIQSWRTKLMVVREKRTPPALDDKVLTGWNGLMIASLAKGGRVLGEPRFTAAAAKAAEFILGNLMRDGRLLRTYRAGQARLTGYLSDYAFLVEGLLNLYEATFDAKWLTAAGTLTDVSIKHYFDEKAGGFFFTASDAKKLIARSKQPHDGAIPSGNSVHAMNLLRLAIMLNRPDYRDKAESIFRAFGQQVEKAGGSFERLLCAVDFHHDKVLEIAILGDAADQRTEALIRATYQRYLPNKVVVGAHGPVADSPIALLAGKTLRGGKPTAYVCENYRCRLPVTSPAELGAQLDAK